MNLAGRRLATNPIQLSIAGDGRVVSLTQWTIRQFMQQLAISNPGAEQLASLFAFPWLKKPGHDLSGWERLKQQENISKLEITKIEKQANYFLARDTFALSPRPKEILSGYVPSNGPLGSRRAKMLPLNGLALELRDISNRELLVRQTETTVITTDEIYGSFKLLRLHGLKMTGRASQRNLACILSSFYDRALQYEYSLSEFRSSRWHQVVGIGALDGFMISGMGNASEQRYTRGLVNEYTRRAKLPKLRRHIDSPAVKNERDVTCSGKAGAAAYAIKSQRNPETESAARGFSQAVQTFTTLHIWELLSNGQEVDPYFDGTTSEFIRWVTETKHTFLIQFANIESKMSNLLKRTPAGRHEAISYIKQLPLSDIAFMIFNDRPYEQAIWRLLRPTKVESFQQQ